MTEKESPSFNDLLGVAEEAARLAGQRIMDYFGKRLPVEWKIDGSPRTRADLEAEEILRSHILGEFPNHGIIGEEGSDVVGSEPVRWLLDPIDGTQTFIRGVPLFGTLVGVEVCGEPVVGVILLPALNECLAAARGAGCLWNGRPAEVSTCCALSESLVVISDQTAAGQYHSFEQISKDSALQRTWGDCYGYALVATGRAEVALDHEMSIWDSAALLPIIEEAGGVFTDWRGLRTIMSAKTLATNGVLHDQVLGLISPDSR